MIKFTLKNTTLVQRFSLLSLTALIIFGIVFGWIVTTTMEQDMLMRSQEITANIISKAVRNEFTVAELINPKTGPDYDVFAEKAAHLSLGPDIVQFNIWNKDMTIVWSNERELVGKRFPDNEELIEALSGETISEISSLEKEEHEFEYEFNRLLELYVPVQFESQGDIEVVFEIYQNLDPLYADISRHQQVVWTSTIVGFALLFLVLFGIMKGASRRIEVQTREIVQSEEKYRSLIQSAQDGIISITTDGTIILFNKAAEEIFGYSADEVIGQSPVMLMPEQYRAKHQASLSRFFKTGEPTVIGKTVEMEGLRRDGRSFPMELSLTASGAADGLIVTGILRDISERKAIQAQLIEGEKQATVSLVAGSIGHELNNIVTALMGFADLLREDPGNEPLAQECAEVFGKESPRLQVHAQNLLALSEPQKLKIKPTSLNFLLDKVTELLSVSGLLKAFTIEKEYSEELPPILGDEMQLEQVIRNLEINAAHAMGNKGVLTLSTRFSKDRLSVEFCVSDTGHGIPEDKRDQIFLPFYTTKEKGKGTGLGMYIVKQIVEQHKGYIYLMSDVGVGTTITIGLPVTEKSKIIKE